VSASLLDDPLLRAVPSVEGYKLLPPCLLTQKLGGGGMGMVYRAFHTKLEIDVAVKVLSPMVASQDPRFVDRFQREARLAARIAPENPNLIHVYDVGEAAGLHYIVMEFVAGETVRERVQRKGRLAEREAIAILAGAANGLASAHVRDVVHRDVKPDNLMVTRDGRVKVADLGLAKATDLGGDQSLSVVMGTPKYMAPEHWLGMEHVTARTDVWALGATLYFMLAGVDPFPGSSQGQPFPDLNATLPHVSAECRALLERCVAPEPSGRFASAKELAEALVRQWPDRGERLADEQAGEGLIRATTVTPPPAKTLALARQTAADPGEAMTLAPRAGTRSSPQPPRRDRRPLLIGAGLLAAVVVVAAVWIAVLLGRRSGDEGRELYLRGRREISQPQTLDVGIATLQQARQLEPEAADVVATLVQAYLARAQRTRDSDLRRALADVAAASQLDGGEEVKRQRDAMVAHVQQRLEDKVRVQVPKEGAVVGRLLDVEVDCSDAPVDTVRVQDREVPVVAGRVHSAVAWAGDGPQVVEVVAAGPLGTSVVRKVAVVVDTAPPLIEITAPPPDSPVGRTVTVAGTVRDATAVRLEARVADGKPSPVVVDAGGFRTDVHVPDAIANGQDVVIALSAVDAAGRPGEASVRLRLDAALPAITLGDFPQRTREPRIELTVRVEDATAVRFGDQAATRRDGFWVGTVELREGTNDILVSATGRAGMAQELPVRIERDATAPRVIGLLPERAEAGTEAVVSGRASEAATVTVDGSPVPVGAEFAFSTKVQLAPERRDAVVVRLRDDVGNETRAEIPVVAKPVAVARALPEAWAHAVLDATPGATSRYPIRVRDVRTGIVFRLIEPGEFLMGSAVTMQLDEQPHRVRITRPFYLAETETTLRQWRTLASGDTRVGRAVGDDHPVAWVSFDDVAGWLQRMNGGRPGDFRLPTEAEWEFACRAGEAKRFAFGDELAKEDANFRGDGTKVAGSLRANAWGLHDMHGNLGEWCQDAYDARFYLTAPADDPLCAGSGRDNERVVRGGSFSSDASYCRSASRQSRPKNRGDKFVGFRVARSLPPG